MTLRRVPLLQKSELKRTRSLNVASAKRKRENREYAVARLVYLAEHPVCMARLEGCTHAAVSVHHRRGRVGSDLLDQRTWLAVCSSCHTYVHAHPGEAYAAGWMIRRNRRGEA